MVFETERCFLRPMNRKDKKDLYRLCDDVNVWRFLGGQGTAEHMRKKIKFIGFTPISNRWSVRLKSDSSFLGEISLTPHHDGNDIEISYLFLSDNWGNGYASETVRSVVPYAFKMKKLNRLVAEAQTANLVSCKVLEKLGFHRIKTLTRFNAEQALYAIDSSAV